MKLVAYSCVVAVILWSSAYALIVGSNTAVSRQAAVTFPAVDVNNQILGFAYMDGGFTLEDFTTTCTYNAFFPIASQIALNGGGLYLLRSIETQSQINFLSAGSIFGLGHSLILTSTIPLILPQQGIQAFRLQDTFNPGQDVNTLDWSYDNNYIVYARDGNVFGVLSFNGTTLSSLVTNATVTVALNSVRFHPTTYYFALGVSGNVGNPGLQIWQFIPGPNTLTQISTSIPSQTVASVSWHPSGDFLAIAKNVGGGQVAVYPFNKLTGALGTPSVTTIPATATFSTKSSIDWSPDGNYLVAGVSANTATELQLYNFNGTSLTFTLGVELGQQVNTVSWAKTGTFIAVGLNGSATRPRVYRHTVQNGTLTLATSLAQNISVLGIDWRNDGNALAYGRASAGGADFYIYTFDKNTPTLTLSQSTDPGSAVNEVRWSKGCLFIAYGSDNNTLTVYRYSNADCLSTTPVVLDNLVFSSEADVLFRSPVVVRGNSILRGNNICVSFDIGASLTIESGASLLCESVTFTNLSSSKLIMADSTSSLTLSNVAIYLEENLSFTQGYLSIQDEVFITGSQIFAYRSGQPSYISANSLLFLDDNLTFSYDPPTASNNLFGFADNSGILHLHDVTLYSTSTGLQLTRGTLKISGICYVSSNAQNVAEAIKFGNGNIAENLNVEILPSAGIDVTSGYLVYNNA